jgi:hypothetical protein
MEWDEYGMEWNEMGVHGYSMKLSDRFAGRDRKRHTDRTYDYIQMVSNIIILKIVRFCSPNSRP